MEEAEKTEESSQPPCSVSFKIITLHPLLPLLSHPSPLLFPSDHSAILEDPRMTRMSLQGGTLNVDLVTTLSEQNRDLRDEMNMHSSGVQFSEMLKKRNAGIFKVFHRSKLVIRDIIFNAWAKYIKERRTQLKNFRTRKLAKIFNHWHYNAKYLKLMSDDPAREFKRKWQEVESENQWLVSERDRLMEEVSRG